MTRYDFLLTFSLPGETDNPEQFLDALFEAGCDDATVGVNHRGLIGLDFSRHAQTAEAALVTAIQDVQKAIPGVRLVQAGPDLVNLTEMAEIFGFSRQNMRKYAAGPAPRPAFPLPAITVEPKLWHLAEIARWLERHTAIRPRRELVEVSKVAARMNLKVQEERINEFA